MLSKLNFHYTSATIVAIVGAVLALVVSFGLDLTQDNINSILTLVGLLGGLIVVGGGAKTAGLARAGITPPNVSWHYSPAVAVAVVAAVIAVAVSFGLHMTQENIDSVLKLVGLILGGIVVGGGFKSGGMLAGGVHPLQTSGKVTGSRAVVATPSTPGGSPSRR